VLTTGDERRCYLSFDRPPYLLNGALIWARMKVEVEAGTRTVVLTFAPLRQVSDIFAPPVAKIKQPGTAPVLPIVVQIERSVSL